MEKRVFNVFYVPEIQYYYKKGNLTKKQLAIFEQKADATMAIDLMNGFDKFFQKKFEIKLNGEGYVYESLVPENEDIFYYKSLMDFALTDEFMKDCVKEKGLKTVAKAVYDLMEKNSSAYGG